MNDYDEAHLFDGWEEHEDAVQEFWSEQCCNGERLICEGKHCSTHGPKED